MNNTATSSLLPLVADVVVGAFAMYTFRSPRVVSWPVGVPSHLKPEMQHLFDMVKYSECLKFGGVFVLCREKRM